MIKRMSVAVATAAVLGAGLGVATFASPSFAASGCTTKALGSTGASATCVSGDHWIIVHCRRAANGAAYTVTGPVAGGKATSSAYCSSGDVRTSYSLGD